MTATTYIIPDGVDNGNGTWTSQSLTDNGNGTWTDNGAADRDIDITASPITTGWQVMGITGYPLAPGPTNNNNGYSAAAVTVDALTAAATFIEWSTGPIWIQE